MSKLYNFEVTTTIRGFVQFELDEDEDVQDFADGLESSTVSYDDMNACFPSEVTVSTEVEQFGEADNRVI